MTTAAAPAPLFTLPGADPAEEPAPRPRAPEPAGGRLHRLAHGRITLDELVSGAWAAVGAGAPAACPVCDGTLRAASAGGAAGCDRCGCSLA